MASAADISIDLSDQPIGLSLAGKVAEGLAREIRRGRFPPGTRLPSSRSLAEQLGVHRNTVLAALDDLLAQGYALSQPRRGIFVSEKVPERRRVVSKKRRSSAANFPLAASPSRGVSRDIQPGELPLLGGLPDLRLVPANELARAYRTALRDAPGLLDYGSERGESRFLRVFSQFLAETRGVVSDEGELMTTRGSQQALYLSARVLCGQEQVIAVESMGYPPAWDSFRLAGARLCPVRVDRGGMVLSDLRRLTEEQRVAAVYVTPHHQYPTTVTMSGPRRTELLRLAQEKRFFIIEDDYDHEFHFEGRPVLPLASFDAASVVVHVGTFSKVFAPGLRLGYVHAQARIIEAMCVVRRVLDRQGDHVVERALCHLIEDGLFAAHLRRVHRVYAGRREILFQELERRLAGQLSFRRPSGGLAVWANLLDTAGGRAQPERAAQWARAARECGVIVQAARELSFDGRHRGCLRLGYPRLDEAQLREAVRRLSSSCPRY